MKHFSIYHLICLSLLMLSTSVRAQVTDPCFVEVGPSGEGYDLASAIDAGTHLSTFHYKDARDSNENQNIDGGPANDIYYSFTLEQPMTVVIHQFCSETYSQLSLYQLFPEDTENFTPQRFEQIGFSNYGLDMEESRELWEPFDSEIPELSNVVPEKGFICMKLEAGIYYVLSEGQRYANGIITTTIHGFATAGNHWNFPIDAGVYASGFTYTDHRNMLLYDPTYSMAMAHTVYYQFTLYKPMDITISGNVGSQPMGHIVLWSDQEGTLRESQGTSITVSQLAEGSYTLICETNSDGQSTVTISGEAPEIAGDSRQLPILLGKKSQSFDYSDTEKIQYFTDKYGSNGMKDIFYQFELQYPMDIEILTCGSEPTTTQVALLNASGTKLSDSADSPSSPCYLSTQGTLIRKSLPAGIYYTIIEGNADSGNMNFYLSGEQANATIADPGTTLSQNKNYIFSISPTQPTTTAIGLGVSQSIQTVNYFDGFGRFEQSVAKGANSRKQDMVNWQEYDSYGRESRKWLPVVCDGKGEYLTDEQVKSRAASSYSGEPATYSYPVYEDSPLARITEQYGCGNDWQQNGKSVKTEYLINLSEEAELNCYHYQVSTTSSQVFTVQKVGNYEDGTLHVMRIQDEDGNTTLAFKALNGQTILERHVEMKNGSKVFYDTYYIYNDFGLLETVLPPMAADAMKTNATWSSSSATFLKEYAYFYQYDERNRCIYKKLPGAEGSFFVYDAADQLVFSQDGNLRSRQEWTFSIADASGRVVLTGVCKNSISNIRTYLKGKTIKAKRNNTTNTYKGYTIEGITLTSPSLYIVNYYDDYQFLGINGFTGYAYDNSKEQASYGMRYTGSNGFEAKGLQTGSLTLFPENSTQAPLCKVNYYDNLSCVVQIQSGNHLGGKDTECYSYNFTGQPLKKLITHTATGKANQTELYSYVYDHAERLLKVSHQLNNAATVILSENVYDKLGRLKTKKLHGGKESSEYTYNIRGWLKQIAGSKYSQNLYYTEGPGTPCYNGNISSMSWKAGNETTTRGYVYTYDALNRLTNASYGEGAGINSNVGRYNESVSQYGKQGNILSLQRYGQTSSSAYGLIDNLTITHNGNQLKNVADASNASAYGAGFNFVDASKATTSEYTYDANGNLTKDLNKKITEIQYNSLNLPVKIQFQDGSSVSNLYSADGVKHQSVRKAGNITTTTDYCHTLIYKNRVLLQIMTENGYITVSNNTPTYHYYIEDYIGNNQVTFNQNGTVEEVNYYYPFGGLFNEKTINTIHPYKYNGNELDRTNGLDSYDFTFRNLDSKLGRFFSMDMLSEQFYSHSPYAYCTNNPIRYSDVLGLKRRKPNMSPEEWKDFDTKKDEILLNEVTITASNSPTDLGYSYSGSSIFGINAQQIFSSTVNYVVAPTATATTLWSGSRYTEHPWGDGYFRTKAGKFYPLSVLDVQANGKYVRGVNFLRTGATNAKNAVKVASTISKALGGISLAFSAYNFRTTPNFKNGVDLAIQGISTTVWEVGLVYDVGKIHWKQTEIDMQQREENMKAGRDPSQGTLNPITHRYEYPIFYIDYNKVLNLK